MKKCTTPGFGAILAIILVVIGLAACGGGGSDATTTTSPSVASWTNAVIPTAQGNQAAMKFAASAMPTVLRAAIGPYNGVSPMVAAEQGLNWAEQTFPQYFPGHKTTQSFECYRYRFYPETGTYVGIAIDVAGKCGGVQEGGAYVMGGAFGHSPVYQGQLTDYVTPNRGDTSSKFSFAVGDVTVRNVTSIGSPPYTITSTVLATQGTEVERIEYAYSNGIPSTVVLYDSQMRDVSSSGADGSKCTSSPPTDSYLSSRGAAMNIGESFTQTSTRSCTTGSGAPYGGPEVNTYTFVRVETISTPAGVFANTRVFTRTTPNSNTLRSWVDPITNRAVRTQSVFVQNGVETIASTTELVSFTIKNYPK